MEDQPPDQLVLFTSRRDDSDAVGPTGGPTVLPFTWPRLFRAIRDPDLELVEVAEPLWPGEWVRAVRYLVAVRALRTRPRRTRVTTATYAIENLDARVRLSAPALDAHPVLSALHARLVAAALGVSVLLLDAIAFGTTGAYENYRSAFGWSLRRARHAVLPPRLDACRVCGPAPDGAMPGAEPAREPTVLFLGTPSERKGFPGLVDAWERAGLAERGWRLVVADPSGRSATGMPPGVSIRSDVSRHEVHVLLRTSAVVAMPSVRRGRWREQIGLPLVEGLAHGCRVVTTTETGLADDLREHPLVTLTTPGDTGSLRDGLLRAASGRAPGRGVPPGSGGYSKADIVRWWLEDPAGVAGVEDVRS